MPPPNQKKKEANHISRMCECVGLHGKGQISVRLTLIQGKHHGLSKWVMGNPKEIRDVSTSWLQVAKGRR